MWQDQGGIWKKANGKYNQSLKNPTWGVYELFRKIGAKPRFRGPADTDPGKADMFYYKVCVCVCVCVCVRACLLVHNYTHSYVCTRLTVWYTNVNIDSYTSMYVCICYTHLLICC